ncbi:hypothetical protein A3K93_09470 [Acinetobacter sp. NCu2D-2]|uniref:hypothetical protein n=1 Tax=Acinetobacter sp. NCu2D-2 TaxID=1608473 RepID=UPI0007CDD043|nr:hypothetical protein [Acinetobacter sp. NCu2D-2]ANF82401.1 hypothetical protein A3K93_09470 [Acinetobacter sp. NCu2D-2]
MKNQTFDWNHHLIAIYYGIFSCIALYRLVPNYLEYKEYLSFLEHVTCLSLMVQAGIALVGMYWYWKQDTRGLVALYWISLSLSFAILTPIIFHIPQFTITLMPYFDFSSMHNSTGFFFKIADTSQLSLFNHQGFGFGINIIELCLFLRFRKIAKKINISVHPSKLLNKSRPSTPFPL